MRGGVLLGEGAQGALHTVDDLPSFVSNATVVLVSYDLATRTEHAVSVDVRELVRRFARVAVVKIDHVSRYGANKVRSSLNEFGVVRAFVRKLRKSDGPMVSRTTSLLVVGSTVIVGLVDEGNSIMMYRRMQATMGRVLMGPRAIGIRSRYLLMCARDVANALCFMESRGVHHCDIKDDNVMCASCRTKRPRFVLIDLGFIAIDVADDEPLVTKGTPGFMSPLLYSDDEVGRQKFEADYMVSRILASPSAVWESFYSVKARDLPTPSKLVKNDLYALGVMLSICIEVLDVERHLVLDVALRLMSGRGTWSLQDAKSMISSALKKTYKRSLLQGANSAPSPSVSKKDTKKDTP